MPKLTLHIPDAAPVKYGLNGHSFTIGRAETNDIILPAGASSGQHAVLKMTDSGDFAVTDLGSTNHTKVNGMTVQTRVLRNGDHILFADVHADYESDVPVPPMDEQPTQIYERSVPAPAQPRAATVTAPAAAPRAPGPVVNVLRPVSTTPRRSSHSSEGGCFALIVFGITLPVAFFVGMTVRHYQDFQGAWIWDYLRTVMHS